MDLKEIEGTAVSILILCSSISRAREELVTILHLPLRWSLGCLTTHRAGLPVQRQVSGIIDWLSVILLCFHWAV